MEELSVIHLFMMAILVPGLMGRPPVPNDHLKSMSLRVWTWGRTVPKGQGRRWYVPGVEVQQGTETEPYAVPMITGMQQSPIPIGRRAILTQQRYTKSKRLKPEGSPFLNRVNLFFERKESIRFLGFRPVMTHIRSGGGVTVGLTSETEHIGGTPMDLILDAAYSQRIYQAYRVRLGRLKSFHRHGWIAYFDAGYLWLPRETFYGLGMNSLKVNRSDYRYQDYGLGIVLGYHIHRRWTLITRLDYRWKDLGPGGDKNLPGTEALFDETTAPGLTDQPNFLVGALNLEWDGRDHPKRPTRGAYLRLEYERFWDQGAGSQYRFQRIRIDARGYFQLFSPARVLALRAFTSYGFEDSGAQAPFFLLDTLGGSRTLRGYRHYRFRDLRTIHFSVEYRWELFYFADAVLFYDTGQAFHDGSLFRFNRYTASYGFGFRFKTMSGVVLRSEIGFSSQDTRVRLVLGQAF